MNAHIGWTPGLRLNLLRSKSNAPQSANPGGVNESGRFMAKRTPEPKGGKSPSSELPELANELQRVGLRLVELAEFNGSKTLSRVGLVAHSLARIVRDDSESASQPLAAVLSKLTRIAPLPPNLRDPKSTDGIAQCVRDMVVVALQRSRLDSSLYVGLDGIVMGLDQWLAFVLLANDSRQGRRIFPNKPELPEKERSARLVKAIKEALFKHDDLSTRLKVRTAAEAIVRAGARADGLDAKRANAILRER